MRSAKAERIFTFSSIIVKNAGKNKQEICCWERKKSRKFLGESDFLHKICRFSVENLTFFELFSRNFDAEKGDNQA